MQKIESGELPRKKGPNGLEYVDVVEGTGASPAVGFQVVASYVAMVSGIAHLIATSIISGEKRREIRALINPSLAQYHQASSHDR